MPKALIERSDDATLYIRPRNPGLLLAVVAATIAVAVIGWGARYEGHGTLSGSEWGSSATMLIFGSIFLFVLLPLLLNIIFPQTLLLSPERIELRKGGVIRITFEWKNVRSISAYQLMTDSYFTISTGKSRIRISSASLGWEEEDMRVIGRKIGEIVTGDHPHIEIDDKAGWFR